MTDLDKAKKVMLKLLIEFDRICKKHNLTYWIDYGTLLGAVRHKGFIPWDDDIDVSMPREDHNKLKEIIKDELPDDMFFQTKKTDLDFSNNITRLIDLNSIYHNNYYFGKYNGIFIDIFPVDTINKKYKWLVKPLRFFYSIDPFKKWYSTPKRRLTHYLLSPLILLKPIINYIKDKVVMDSNGELYVLDLMVNTPGTYKKKYFEEFIELTFEKNKFDAPKKYHEVLTSLYGDYNKLPPKEMQKSTHHLKITFLK